MVTQKYNFKKFLKSKYPDILCTPIYGTPAYLLSKDLDAKDAFDYQTQPLESGQFVAFVGVSASDIKQWMRAIKSGVTLTHLGSPRNTCAPTTFASFEGWLKRRKLIPTHRTYCHQMSPRKCFHTDQIKNCVAIDAIANWYMYEFKNMENTDELLMKVPYVQISNMTIVLIKAGSSNYVSKKQAFAEMFQRLSPLYDKLVSSCAIAADSTKEDPKRAEIKWNEAKVFAEEYLHIQFENNSGTVDLRELQEAYYEGLLAVFLRDINSLHTNVAKGADGSVPEDAFDSTTL